LPNTTYLLTRRCIGRQFLLKPSKFTNQVLLYCLAVAADKYNILVHAFTALSNHYHLAATDPDGNLPEFMRYLNEFTAKAMNAHWGRWESFFAPGSYSAVKLLDADAVMDKLVYTITNPVDARLVPHSHQWPGICLQPSDMGKTLTVKRPWKLFRKDGPMPKAVTLRIVPPPPHLRDEIEPCDETAFIASLAENVAAQEARLRKQAASAKKQFMGRKRVLAQHHTDTPWSQEPRRRLNPRIAGRDAQRRIEAIAQMKDFIAEYHRAWEKFRDGVRDTLFPHGTYALRLYQGVQCAPSG
jgi:REP element-mobilizing transposase RayT